MPNDLFSDVPFVDPTKNYLEELVGEGKKFTNPEELARGKAESDAHIARLEDEQRRLREELETRINLEKFLDKLEQKPPLSNQQPQADGEPAKETSAMSQEEIERLLEQKLTQHKNTEIAQQNLNAVRAQLLKVLGPNYAQQLKQRATDLAMSEVEIQRMAQSSPKALFKLLGLDETQNRNNLFEAPPRSQNNFNSIPQGQKRGDSYYEQLRKDKPSEYWSPKVQNEIFARIQEMGSEEFYKS